MKTRVLTQTEVAQKVLAMFPPTWKRMSNVNHVDIYDETGNSVVEVEDWKSGVSKVTGSKIDWKSYSRLSAAEKREFVKYIEEIEVDKVTETETNGREWSCYFIKGTYEKRGEKGYYIKESKVEPFNY